MYIYQLYYNVLYISLYKKELCHFNQDLGYYSFYQYDVSLILSYHKTKPVYLNYV